MNSHQKIALVIAVIISLAEVVIVYELWIAGMWIVSGNNGWWLSAAKTAAFVLLFVGSLLAEMQSLSSRTRWLLLAAVMLLGGYQAATNIVVNYSSAIIPQSAVEFFQPTLTPMQTKFAIAIADGAVRSIVVVIMWMVTGLVWRGVATVQKVDNSELQSKIDELQRANEELSSHCQVWSTLSQAGQLRLLFAMMEELNGNGEAVEAAARRQYGSDKVSRAKRGG